MINIDNLAELARIKLNPDEKEKLQGEFEAILNYISQLEEVDASSISDEEIGNIIGLKNSLREDRESPNKSGEFTEILLKEAPAVENNYVKVKDVLNKK